MTAPLFEIKSRLVAAVSGAQLGLSYFDLKIDIFDCVLDRGYFCLTFTERVRRLVVCVYIRREIRNDVLLVPEK